MDKTSQDKIFQTKDPLSNLPDKNPSEQLREFVQGACVRVFVLGLLKIEGGGPRCVTYFRGVPGCVTKCDREEGVKIGQKSVTYFMDGPLVYVYSFLAGMLILVLVLKDSLRTFFKSLEVRSLSLSWSLGVRSLSLSWSLWSSTSLVFQLESSNENLK